MLTDTQLTGLRLALDNAGALGIDVEPWVFLKDGRDNSHEPLGSVIDPGWSRADQPLFRTYVSNATPEHYDAMCARYADKLWEEHETIVVDVEGDTWVAARFDHYDEDGIDARWVEPSTTYDDKLTALVHALASAEGKEVVG